MMFLWSVRVHRSHFGKSRYQRMPVPPNTVSNCSHGAFGLFSSEGLRELARCPPRCVATLLVSKCFFRASWSLGGSLGASPSPSPMCASATAFLFQSVLAKRLGLWVVGSLAFPNLCQRCLRSRIEVRGFRVSAEYPIHPLRRFLPCRVGPLGLGVFLVFGFAPASDIW